MRSWRSGALARHTRAGIVPASLQAIFVRGSCDLKPQRRHLSACMTPTLSSHLLFTASGHSRHRFRNGTTDSLCRPVFTDLAGSRRSSPGWAQLAFVALTCLGVWLSFAGRNPFEISVWRAPKDALTARNTSCWNFAPVESTFATTSTTPRENDGGLTTSIATLRSERGRC